ncbi:MAG: tRNA pseudouridine(55) synthase TruB [Clostridia bacterium]
MEGVLIINKPKDFSSHDVVNVLRKELNTKKVGHTGTLDPKATGVLPILIGNATKISKYLVEHDKTYSVVMELGIRTDTLDSEGKILETRKVETLDEEKIKEVLSSFLGKQKQIPPMYSAIKINGKKAYEYARNGQVVEITPREIEIYEMKFKKYFDNQISFIVKCSKGTYIRTLCQDIAKRLGTIAYMKELQRTDVDIFNIKDAISIDDIKNKKKDVKEAIISIEEVFSKNGKIVLADEKLQYFLNGVKLTFDMQDGIYRVYQKNKFIGLGILEKKLLKRDVIVEGEI